MYRGQNNNNQNVQILSPLGNIVNGIENLGCTCFASSTLQQLANIPEFTSMILKYPIDRNKNENYDYADDLLCQF